jgi:hypothetical protein
MPKRIPVACTWMLWSATLLSAAAPIRVTWNTSGFALTAPPVFQTKGLQKQGTVIVRLELSPQGAVKQANVIVGDAALRPIRPLLSYCTVQVPICCQLLHSPPLS